MCGIAGYVGRSETTRERIEECLRRMRHRGPDFAAHRGWTTPDGRRIDLLHTRLSIIDLDPRAHQPFRRGTKWMAYNGELYNYREIRADLAARGEAFETESDTEVLLRLWDIEGEKGLARCEGMWAFAVYDESDGSLVLCRDRFGEKPLYLYSDDGGLFFGSEVKCLAALRGRRFEANRDHLSRYLVNGYKSLYKTHETFFRGVGELPPATMLRLDSGGRQERISYWAPKYAPEEEMTYTEAVSGTRERLARAVEIRLRADVPLAFCLSGGIDSNALIGAARRLCGHEVHGFTIANSDIRYEEADLVRAAVEELGIRHTAVPVRTEGFLPRLRDLVRAHDAPVYTITYYAQAMLLEEIAAQGYRVSVSGTGADEIFSGYFDHHLFYLARIQGDTGLAAARAAWEEKILPWVRNPFLRDPDLFIRDPDFRGHIYLNADEFSNCLLSPRREPFTEEPYSKCPLRNRMLNELLHESVPVILHEDDLNSMRVSVENRSPYLDRELVEFSLRIPTRLLVREGLAKAVLRDAARGLMPEAVRTNPRKVGFNIPIQSYLDASDPAVRGEILAPSPVFDLLRRDRVEALLDRETLPNSESKFLFYFLCAKIFLEEFA